MTPAPFVTPPDPNPKTPEHPIPAGACDCHFHVFDGPSPQIATRSYSAHAAPLGAYRSVQKSLGLNRSVIVQPSIYGTDNRTTMNAVSRDDSMRAVVVVGDQTRKEDLRALAERGAVGARLNLMFSKAARLESLSSLTNAMADLGWHIQILADVSKTPDLMPWVRTLPVPAVFDHMGHVQARNGVEDPAFQGLLRLLETGNHWVKLSGAYRISTRANDAYGDVHPMAQALISANPDRVVWGSDWPHPAFEGPMPNDGDLLDLLFTWAGTKTAHKVLVDNPEQLYGFAKGEAAR